MAEFKPNIYPIMYWAIAYGVAAGLALFLLRILSTFISLVWVPVFLAGLVWGGYRNYEKQKKQWHAAQGTPAPVQSPVQEFKSAVKDIADVSQEMIAQERQEAARQVLDQEETPEAPGGNTDRDRPTPT